MISHISLYLNKQQKFQIWNSCIFIVIKRNKIYRIAISEISKKKKSRDDLLTLVSVSWNAKKRGSPGLSAKEFNTRLVSSKFNNRFQVPLPSHFCRFGLIILFISDIACIILSYHIIQIFMEDDKHDFSSSFSWWSGTHNRPLQSPWLQATLSGLSLSLFSMNLNKGSLVSQIWFNNRTWELY